MISGTAKTNKGRTLIVLGVERENIARLTGGRPIVVTPEKHCIPGNLEIVIFFGETSEDVRAQLQRAGVDISRLINRSDEGERT